MIILVYIVLIHNVVFEGGVTKKYEEPVCAAPNSIRVIYIEDHISIRPDRSLLLGRHTSEWYLWDVIFHKNDSTFFLVS